MLSRILSPPGRPPGQAASHRRGGAPDTDAPDYNSIEHLWRNIKRRNTHDRYFPTFADLTTAVDTAVAYFQDHPSEVQQLMGTYLDQMAALAEIKESAGEAAWAASPRSLAGGL